MKIATKGSSIGYSGIVEVTVSGSFGTDTAKSVGVTQYEPTLRDEVCKVTANKLVGPAPIVA